MAKAITIINIYNPSLKAGVIKAEFYFKGFSPI
jgi:hypothetical protein